MSNSYTNKTNYLDLLVTAAALLRDQQARRSVAYTYNSRKAVTEWQARLNEHIRPAIASVITEVQQVAQRVAKKQVAQRTSEAAANLQDDINTTQTLPAKETLADLQEKGSAFLASANKNWQETQLDAASALADKLTGKQKEATKAYKQAKKRGLSLLATAKENVEDMHDGATWSLEAKKKREAKRFKAARHDAKKAGSGIADSGITGLEIAGLKLLTEGQDQVQHLSQHFTQNFTQHFLGAKEHTLEGKQQRAAHVVGLARAQAEKELRKRRREWKLNKLEKAISKKVAPLHKEFNKEIKLLEKQTKLARKSDLFARDRNHPSFDLAKHNRRKATRTGGGLTTVLLIAGGAFVLARFPVVRQNILNAVETVSPDAAESLRKAGKTARDLIGTVWIERPEESTSTAPDTKPTS